MPRRRRTSLSTQVSSAHEMEGRNHVPWEPYPLSFPAEYRHPMSLQMPARVPHPALLEKELEMQHVEVCRLLDENRRLVEDRMALQHELGAGKEELHRMSLMIADSRAQLEIRSRELTERNLKLEIDHQALQHQLGSAREKLHRLNLMIADIQAQHEIRSRELTETILKLEAEHRALEPLKHLRHEVTRLSTVKQDLSSQVETLSEDIARLQGENGQIPSLRAEIDVLRQDLLCARSAAEYESKAKVELCTVKQDLSSQVETLSKDIARLQGENEQIPSLRAEIDVLRQDLLRARSAAEYENKAKNELSAVKQDLSSQVGTLSKDITRLQGENEQVPSLRAEIDVLRLGLLRARSVAEYENKAKIELCAVKQDLSSQVGTLSKDIARLQGENEQIPSLRAEIDVLRQDLLCARSAAEYEKRAKIELYTVKQDLSSQVEILAKDIARLQGENEQIPSLRSEIDVLHQDLVCARSAAKYENKAKTELMDQMQIDKNGLEKPSAIQQGGIVPFHQHVQSASEKIAAFCSEILQRLDYGLVQCQVLFLAPTCERAHQIENVLRVLGSHLGVKIHACVVGSSVEEDKHTLSAGVHLVVGTPGRVLDMLRRKRQSLLPNHIKMFVLDEADEMLSRGFKDQVLGVRHAAQPNASIIG